MTGLTLLTTRIVLISSLFLLISYFLVPEILGSVLGFEPEQIDSNNVSSETDVLIIGGSHAGLAAALTLARHQVDSIIFDAGEPRNQWNTPVHVLPAWENRDPEHLRKASRAELRKVGFSQFVNTKISTIARPGGNQSHFTVSNAEGRTWTGKKLLLATGVQFAYPNIPGYQENFPELILHCLFTRALEFKGSRSAGLLALGLTGSAFHAVMLVEDALKFAKTVTVYTNGNTTLADEVRSLLQARGEDGVQIDGRHVTRLAKNSGNPGIQIQLDGSQTVVEDFLVHQPDTHADRDIVAQLGLDTDGRGDIASRMPFYHTTVPGVFVAGDVASPFKIIPNALFQGSNAGAGIARELPRRVTGHPIDRPIGQKIWHFKDYLQGYF